VRERSQKTRAGRGESLMSRSVSQSVDRSIITLCFNGIHQINDLLISFTQNSDDTFSFLYSHIGPIGDS